MNSPFPFRPGIWCGWIPSELPPGQKILGEISDAIRRAVRDKGEEEGKGVLSSITRSVSDCRKLPSTLAELRERSEWRRS